ncbi:hypothetical protein [Candidatus Coxiella mudrowiae]|uniref:hypothetical protein n=1 Tax=Candidatus Coxiella mudrowiae TaxID=2054173 RepID=UPI000C2954D3|nr:hypothetical protein [Candidatus Coxiella mudrowiae]
MPVIAPIETMVDGVKDKNWKEVLLGGTFLSLDLWFGAGLLASKGAEEVAGSALVRESLAASWL